MTSLSVIIFACLPLVTIGWMSCPQSIPTVSFVSRCPSDAKEWMMAAGKKDCGAMEKYQNCSNDGSFVYHCVLNEEATMLLEVCAPIWYMSGYCARFSIANKRLVNNPGLDCTKSAPPCPARFPSNESFKYPMCYRYVTSLNNSILNGNPIGSPQASHNEQQQSSGPVLMAFLSLFVLTTFCLLILLIFGKKLKNRLTFCAAGTTQGGLYADPIEECTKEPLVSLNKEFKHEVNSDDNGENAEKESSSQLQGEGPVEKQEDTLQQNLMNEDAESMEIRTMSEERQMISLKDVKNVEDLLQNLSKQLEIGKEHLWIVNKENGILYREDTIVNPENYTSFALVIGNKMRETAQCRMNCRHGTDAETLFKMIRDMLPGTEYVEIHCPLCKTKWEKDELVKKCQMSEDEKRFFDCVLRVNEETRRRIRGHQSTTN